MNAIAVLKERPFDGRLRRLEVDWNAAPSIAEILDAQDDVPDYFRERCVARVIDELVPREMWRYVRPKPYAIRDGKVIDVIVIFSLPLESGGGGGQSSTKNTIATVASIAVLLTAVAIQPWLASIVGPTFAAIGTAAFAIGATLAIHALVPPPSLLANQSGINSDNGTNSAAALSGNVLAKGNAVPRVIGTHRIFPPIITPPLNEIVGNFIVAEAVYGLAGPHTLSDLHIGTTSSASIPDLQVELQEGLPTSPVLSLVTRQSFSDPTSVQPMDEHDIGDGSTRTLLNQTDPTQSLPKWQGLTSRIAPDEIWIHLSFVAGLLNINISNYSATVPIRLRMRQTGTTDWINLPELHVTKYSNAPFQVAIKLMFESDLTLNGTSGKSNFSRAYVSVPTQTVAPLGTGGWDADAYFYDGSGSVEMTQGSTTSGVLHTNLWYDRAEFYLSGSKFPKSGKWDIQIIRGFPFSERDIYANYLFDVNGNPSSTDKQVIDFFGYNLDGSGVAKIENAPSNFAQTIELSQFSSIWNEPPVPDPSLFAVIAAKVKGRSIDQLSVLASGYVYDWDGTGWNTLTTTSNPAAHLYDVYAGRQGGSPLPAEIIDIDGLAVFRSFCDDHGYVCNAVVEGKTYLDVATMIAACGYARPAHSELWGVCIDQDTSSSSPVQAFTPRNTTAFSTTKAFPRIPTGIRASYNDSTKDYLQTELIVFTNPDYPDSSRLEQITYDGLVTEAEVLTRATFDIRQIQQRLSFYKFTCDAETLICQRGDLVAVQTDTFDNYAGSSRIASVTRDSGNIVGLTLDGTIPVMTNSDIFSTPDLFTVPNIFDLGAKTGLCIRLRGGGGILNVGQVTAVANDDEFEITFATPFPDTGTDVIDVGCLVTSGRLGTEYRRMKVFSVMPQSERLFDITLVDEAPGLWA
jgi:hypothetical protein